MFPVAPAFVILTFLVIAVAGAMVAVLSGVLLSAVLRLGFRGAVVLKDALLGAAGSVVTVIACFVLPWPRNTVTTRLGPGVHVETTMSRFQHEYIAAMVIVIIFTVFHQVTRLKLERR